MAKIGIEFKVTVDDASALLQNPALLAVLRELNAYVSSPEYQSTFVNPQPTPATEAAEPTDTEVDPAEADDTLSAADAADLALESALRESAERVAAADKLTRKRTKVAAPKAAPPAPAPAAPESLKQGDKTATIRNFVLSRPDGVTPKEILRYLRENFVWARESTSLANTVHTSLNNMLKRSVLTYDEQRRTYSAAGESVTRAPAKAVEPVVESVVEVAAPAPVDPEPEVAAAPESEVVPVLTFTDEELAAKAEEMRANPQTVPNLFE